MEEQLILARMEFEIAYRTYTEASCMLSLARTAEERSVAEESFQRASDNFNQTFQHLKEMENGSQASS